MRLKGLDFMGLVVHGWLICQECHTLLLTMTSRGFMPEWTWRIISHKNAPGNGLALSVSSNPFSIACCLAATCAACNALVASSPSHAAMSEKKQILAMVLWHAYLTLLSSLLLGLHPKAICHHSRNSPGSYVLQARNNLRLAWP